MPPLFLNNLLEYLYNAFLSTNFITFPCCSIIHFFAVKYARLCLAMQHIRSRRARHIHGFLRVRTRPGFSPQKFTKSLHCLRRAKLLHISRGKCVDFPVHLRLRLDWALRDSFQDETAFSIHNTSGLFGRSSEKSVGYSYLTLV